jgi:hypothetical protein
MISKVIRAAAVLAATLVIPAAVLVAPLPASADTIIYSAALCEVNGQGFCLNTANFNLYTSVYESGSGARTINAVQQSNNHNYYLLQFKGATSKCVASDNAGHYVEVKACSGSNGVVWTLITTGDGFLWLNNYASGLGDGNKYLTGFNMAGGLYSVETYAIHGGDQRFQFL